MLTVLTSHRSRTKGPRGSLVSSRVCLVAATLLLAACSEEPAVQAPPGTSPSSDEAENEAENEDDDTSSTGSPSTGSPSTGADDKPKPKDAGVGPIKPMDAGSIATPPSTDAGAPTVDDPVTSVDAATPSATARPVATSLSFPVTNESHAKDKPNFNITRPTDLNASEGLLPVVVWANGGCVRSDFTWAPLFKRWASAGFVVLSLTSESTDEGLGGLLSALNTTSKVEHKQLIDWVVAQNKAGPYAGKLDLERVIVAGNSCGGVTALEVAAEDDRLAGVFVLSGSSAVGSVDKAIMGAVKVPVGYIVGGEEDIAGANARGDYAALKEGIPAMIVNRREGDHQTVSTDEKILPEDAEIALNWMDLVLYGTPAAYDALTSKNVCDKCTPGDWTLTAKHLEKLKK